MLVELDLSLPQGIAASRKEDDDDTKDEISIH
jgi:hypothetical protein